MDHDVIAVDKGMVLEYEVSKLYTRLRPETLPITGTNLYLTEAAAGFAIHLTSPHFKA